jgi:hypothetical protein
VAGENRTAEGGRTVDWGFCRERALSEHAFSGWRQRLGKGNPPVRFALVDTENLREEARSGIELILASGDRLRIPSDAATLKLVLGVLREPA